MGNSSHSENPGSDDTIEIAKAISAFRLSLGEKDIASFASIICGESRKYGYDWELLLAIIRAESQFNVRAKSSKGAMGLMQLMPTTARWLSSKMGVAYKGTDSLYEPKYNIKLGIYYLHMMHKKFGDMERAVIAYNRDPVSLLRCLRKGQELRSKHLAKVMNYYEELKDNSGESEG